MHKVIPIDSGVSYITYTYSLQSKSVFLHYDIVIE